MLLADTLFILFFWSISNSILARHKCSFYKIVKILVCGWTLEWLIEGRKEDQEDFGTVLWPKLIVKMNHSNMTWSGPSAATISHYSCTSSTIIKLPVIYLKYLRNECGSIMLGFVSTETSFNKQIALVYFKYKFTLYPSFFCSVKCMYTYSFHEITATVTWLKDKMR